MTTFDVTSALGLPWSLKRRSSLTIASTVTADLGITKQQFSVDFIFINMATEHEQCDIIKHNEKMCVYLKIIEKGITQKR